MNYRHHIIQSILPLLIGIMVTSCEGDIQVPLPPYWGEASALKNGEVWKPKVLAGNRPTLDPNMDFIWVNMIWHLPQAGYQREGLGLNEINVHHIGDTINLNDTITLGKFTRPTNGHYSTYQSDGDVPADQYEILKSADNYAILTFWDPDKMEVKGEFQCTFVREDPLNPILLDFPDTVRFTRGTFHTRVHKR